MITTVIFDMNGVIIEDEAVHELAFREICQNLGIELTPKLYRELCMGRTDKAGFQEIIKKFALKNCNVEKLVDAKAQRYLKLLPTAIKACPGVLELIKTLEQDFRLALTSSSSSKEVEMVVASFRIKDFFDVIVSADDVVQGKPDPEPYLLTAKRLREKPENCLVIEDSQNGILSAKAAGMYCVAITTTHNKKDLAKADLVIDSFLSLTKELILNC